MIFNAVQFSFPNWIVNCVFDSPTLRFVSFNPYMFSDLILFYPTYNRSDFDLLTFLTIFFLIYCFAFSYSKWIITSHYSSFPSTMYIFLVNSYDCCSNSPPTLSLTPTLTVGLLTSKLLQLALAALMPSPSVLINLTFLLQYSVINSFLFIWISSSDFSQ